MTVQRLPLIALIALAFMGAPSLAGVYEDCILEGMKGASNSSAVAAIKAACEVKATPMRCRDRVLLPAVERATKVKRDEQAKSKEAALAKACGAADAKGEPCYVRYGAGYFETDPAPEIYQGMKEQCLRECESAPWHTRKFGECKTG